MNIGNWTEDRESVLVGGASVGGSGRFQGTTTQRTSYRPEVSGRRVFVAATHAQFIRFRLLMFLHV